MKASVNPSSDLSGNSNSIIENCRDDLATAQRLVAAESRRLAGMRGCSIGEFEQNMREAIAKGAKSLGDVNQTID